MFYIFPLIACLAEVGHSAKVESAKTSLVVDINGCVCQEDVPDVWSKKEPVERNDATASALVAEPVIREALIRHASALPENCKKLFNNCGFTALPGPTTGAVSEAFKACCTAGNQAQSACHGTAQDVFGGNQAAALVTEGMCKKLIDLFHVHNDWVEANSATLLQEGDELVVDTTLAGKPKSLGGPQPTPPPTPARTYVWGTTPPPPPTRRRRSIVTSAGTYDAEH